MKILARIIEINNIMKVLVLSLMLSVTLFTSAQEQRQIIHRPAQITLISPLGTNGLQSGQVVNNISLNIIAGYSAGVKGAEVGAFVNAVNGDVSGTQVAGFVNIVKGNVKGVQVAGFANVNKKQLSGAQIAGFTNVTGNHANTLQISGFANVTKGDAEIGQVSGFVNVSTGSAKFLQLAGFMNYAHESITGTQISVVNYTSKVKGVQVGIVNIADSVEKGVPIGVFTYVRNGYKSIELSSTETIHTLISLKTGTNRFYNIFSAGSIFNNNAWAVGYGVGTLFNLTEKMDVGIEASAYHINEGKDWYENLNLLNRLSLNVSYTILPKVSVFAGIGGNVAVSDITNSEGVLVGSKHIPWYSYNENHNGVNVKMYAGFNAGVRVKL